MGYNNPHHYTNYSNECVADGAGCDGFIPEFEGLACDCPCHGPYAPDFVTDEDVRQWHAP
jgi:hypothetical protein